MPNHHPYTGASAFAHKGGLHASAIARFPEAYVSNTRPEAVGNTQRMLVSELAGKASLIAKAKNLGIDLAQHPLTRRRGSWTTSSAASGGAISRRLADGSQFALLLQWHLGAYRPHFTLEASRVIVDDHGDTGALAKDAMSEAHHQDPRGRPALRGHGRGRGSCRARWTTRCAWPSWRFYPEVADIELVDYKVRILDE